MKLTIQGLDPDLKIDFAYNGKEAIDKVTSRNLKILHQGEKNKVGHPNIYPYRLIIMECCMPNLDGFEATKVI